HPLTTAQMEALATADAFACFGLSRREALWAAGAAAAERPDRLPGHLTPAPTLPGMDEVDRLVADVWATGLSPDSHPAQLVRDRLARAVAALPPGRPHQPGPGGARRAGAGRGGHQPARRPDRPAAGPGPHHLPRFPMTVAPQRSYALRSVVSEFRLSEYPDIS